MKLITTLSLIASLLLTSCSLYRSDGRKDFESESFDFSASAYVLRDCKIVSSLESWLNQEFPQKNYELITTSPQLEVWLYEYLSYTEIKTFQKNSDFTQICEYAFEDRSAWNIYQDTFLKELDNTTAPVPQNDTE